METCLALKDGHCIESIQKNVFRYFVFGKSDKIFTQSAFYLKTFKLNHSAVTHQFSKTRQKNGPTFSACYIGLDFCGQLVMEIAALDGWKVRGLVASDK